MRKKTRRSLSKSVVANFGRKVRRLEYFYGYLLLSIYIVFVVVEFAVQQVGKAVICLTK